MAARRRPPVGAALLAALLCGAKCLAGGGGEAARLEEACEDAGGGALCHPASGEMTRQAPEEFTASCSTTRGDVTLRSVRRWAPVGVDRLYNLLRLKFFDGQRVYRVLPGFVAQWGVPAEPAVAAVFDYVNGVPGALLGDEPAGADPPSNERGAIAFSAQYENGPHSRAVNRSGELYVNFASNARLDPLGFAVVARVVSGMEAFDRMYSGYGEMKDVCGLHPELNLTCDGPVEANLYGRVPPGGELYLEEDFPRLDKILECRVTEPGEAARQGNPVLAILALAACLASICAVGALAARGLRGADQERAGFSELDSDL